MIGAEAWQNQQMAPPRRWFDPTQPQTLQAAVIFCYVNAVLGLLYFLALGAALPLILLVGAVGANGIANERKWGYWVAVVSASLYVLTQLVAFVSFARGLSGLLNLAFAAVLVVLLLHPMSRRYQKVYFR